MGDGERVQQGHTPRKVGRWACTSTVHSSPLFFALTCTFEIFGVLVVMLASVASGWIRPSAISLTCDGGWFRGWESSHTFQILQSSSHWLPPPPFCPLSWHEVRFMSGGSVWARLNNTYKGDVCCLCLPAQVRVMLAPSFSTDDVITAAGQRGCVCVSVWVWVCVRERVWEWGIGSCHCLTCFCFFVYLKILFSPKWGTEGHRTVESMLLVNKGRPHVTVGHVLGGMHTRFQYQFTHTAPKKGVAHSSMSYTGNNYYKTATKSWHGVALVRFSYLERCTALWCSEQYDSSTSCSSRDSVSLSWSYVDVRPYLGSYFLLSAQSGLQRPAAPGWFLDSQ